MRVFPTFVLTVIPLMLSATARCADFETGQEAYNSGDYETALAAWQPLAEGGNADGRQWTERRAMLLEECDRP